MRGMSGLIAAGLAAAVCLGGRAGAGVLLDYGYAESFNDAGVVRGAGGDAGAFGFSQFQLFSVADAGWRIDSVTLHLRLWNTASEGAAGVAVYAADGLFPDLSGPIGSVVPVRADSMSTSAVSADLGGLVLGPGDYYIGLTASAPGTDLLWMPGETPAAHHAVRSDGRVFTWYNPALSLTITGGVVPAPAGVLVLAGVGVMRRRR